MRLIIVDTNQIQSYIFGSNRLRENLGASHLVAMATEMWAHSAVRAATHRHNINSDGTLDATKHINDSKADLDAEVLYGGGGNFVVVFRNDEGAKAFSRELSRKALKDAPNLQLVISQQPFDWGESLYEKVKAAFKRLAEEKRARPLSVPLLGLGVTVMCQSTALPAAGVTPRIRNEPGYPASAEILAKIDTATKKGLQPSEADARLHQDIPIAPNYDYPADFEHLGGTKGEYSHLAIVHADGNGIGQRILAIGRAQPTADKNRDYVNSLRSFSDKIEEAAQAALNRTLARLVRRLQLDGGDRIVHKNAVGKFLVEIDLTPTEGGLLYLPFRPIIFGGDDVTFVCDGRLGLSMAVAYLQAFEEETARRPECGGRITACAGIAIVKNHYPFARAYALADELCKSAKRYRRHEDLEGSCLDWHFALSGLSGDIEEIREREYKAPEGRLTLRPVMLTANPKKPQRAWTVVWKGIEAFQDLPPSTGPDQKPKWSTRRNKIKALRDALRTGRESVKHFRMKFNENNPLPEVEPSMANLATEGWQGDFCGYFDAIELADWFIPL